MMNSGVDCINVECSAATGKFAIQSICVISYRNKKAPKCLYHGTNPAHFYSVCPSCEE